MNRKQFLWFLLAAVIFVGSGLIGVRSAERARENAAAAAAQWSESLASALSARGGGLDLPDEPYAARLDVSGTIASSGAAGLTGGYGHQEALDYIDALTEDENNRGILLFIDSPGGEMKASDELYLALMDYKEATGRPILCYFDGTACSGGYYVAMAADRICADRNCICVNIGVYISTYNFSELFGKLGVEQVAFKSSENKGIGMSGVPWTEEQREIYQSIVDGYYGQFLEVVAAGRGMTAEQVARLNDGREMLASQALEAGFIDEIGRYEAFEKGVLEELGTEVLYERRNAEPSVQDLLRYFTSRLPRSDTQALLAFTEDHGGMVVMACDADR